MEIRLGKFHAISAGKRLAVLLVASDESVDRGEVWIDCIDQTAPGLVESDRV